MKNFTHTSRNLMLLIASLLLTNSLLFADSGASEVYLSGESNSSAGDFVVQTTKDIYHYQGRVYEVYKVNYDNPSMNMKIAVNTEGNCNSFVAYNGQFSFFYNCNKHGFGVRKVMFANPWVNEQFSPDEYHDQSVLMNQKRIEKKQALRLIACYMPLLYE